MADAHLFLFFIFIFFCNPHRISSSTCTLDFKQFPYEARSKCFDAAGDSNSAQSDSSCCHLALQSIFKAMAVRANQSQSIFLDPAQGQDCSAMFQALHNRTNLSNCKLQDFITSTAGNPCSRDVNSIIESLGIDRYNALHSDCKDLSISEYSDSACRNCVESYQRSLTVLKEGNGDGRDGRLCDEALLVSLASSDVGSMNWVHGTFSCLGDEIEFPWTTQEHKKGSLLSSKKLLAAIIVALSLVILAPVLFKITQKRLQKVSNKEIENLSVVVLNKAMEEHSIHTSGCFGLFAFSKDEIAKATNCFSTSNLIGEGNLGKIYLGVMPSGMKVAIKKLNEGLKLHDLVGEIGKMAKIRHPNLVSTLGYCDRGYQCLVYEFCANGNLESWLLGGQKMPVLTWEQRLKIAISVARGLWFMQNNPIEKMAHGDIKLSNILLNERLEAKISDSILSNCNTKEMKFLVAIATDVFNFGVVLLQLLTGRSVVDLSSSRPRCLINEARDVVMKEGNACAIADPRLNRAYDPIAFQSVLFIAVLCTSPSQRQRPNMVEILQKLQDT